MKYCMSLLANAGTLGNIIEICENIFKVLLSKSKSKFCEAKQFLDMKIATIETFIKESFVSLSFTHHFIPVFALSDKLQGDS